MTTNEIYTTRTDTRTNARLFNKGDRDNNVNRGRRHDVPSSRPDEDVKSSSRGGGSPSDPPDEGSEWRPHAGIVARFLYNGRVYYITPTRQQTADEAILLVLKRVITDALLD